ncbi:endonuclease domain-containing protein [Mycobacterium sp. WMMD1722]|uniref:endonuclease domain-containing protein n=1 Tax=Mycobacterium sp. WMMD1722 TaxID=3404117 RepID=UPI003BF5DF92
MELIRGSEALARRQLTRNDLRRRYRRLLPDVYLRADVPLTALTRARAAALWAGPDAVLVGLSAAAVLGTRWLDDDAPAEVIRADRHSPKGVVVRAYSLAPEHICVRRGVRLTTAARTAFDIGRTRPPPKAVPILDALLNATGSTPIDVGRIAEAGPGLRGVRQVKAVLKLVDGGAESPQESRLRMRLVAAGLPKPQTQIEFFDDYGEAFIRVDMGWREWKVAVEYDGVQHWTDSRQRAWDIERIALLEAMGWSVIRVSAPMLRRPDAVIDRVRTKLRQAGCPI